MPPLASPSTRDGALKNPCSVLRLHPCSSSPLQPGQQLPIDMLQQRQHLLGLLQPRETLPPPLQIMLLLLGQAAAARPTTTCMGGGGVHGGPRSELLGQAAAARLTPTCMGVHGGPKIRTAGTGGRCQA